MSQETQTALEAAWKEREKKWREGSALIVKGNQSFNEIMAIPGALRVVVWFGVSEASHEAAQQIADGYRLRMEADLIWHDAVVAAYGNAAKIRWEFIDEKKSYRCILPTGEVFDP